MTSFAFSPVATASIPKSTTRLSLRRAYSATRLLNYFLVDRTYVLTSRCPIMPALLSSRNIDQYGALQYYRSRFLSSESCLLTTLSKPTTQRYLSLPSPPGGDLQTSFGMTSAARRRSSTRSSKSNPDFIYSCSPTRNNNYFAHYPHQLTRHQKQLGHWLSRSSSSSSQSDIQSSMLPHPQQYLRIRSTGRRIMWESVSCCACGCLSAVARARILLHEYVSMYIGKAKAML